MPLDKFVRAVSSSQKRSIPQNIPPLFSFTSDGNIDARNMKTPNIKDPIALFDGNEQNVDKFDNVLIEWYKERNGWLSYHNVLKITMSS